MRVLPRGLRARSAAGFALLALVLSLVLSLATYQLARWYLLDQRESLAVRQASLHALVLGGQLSGLANATDEEVLSLLAQTKGRAVLQVGDTWYAPVVGLDQSQLPAGLVDASRAGAAQQQRIFINSVPYVVVGIPLRGAGAVYFEFVPATEYERTLGTLAYVLAAVASVTTALGALSGWILSRRVLAPLDSIAVSAHAMSEGDLQQRLEVGDDPDLRSVADSFNAMAASLEARIAREQRFTADVSHELRTPLTAMSSAVALAQRSDDATRTAFAVAVLADQVDHLRRLILELLELARIDAGRDEIVREHVDVSALVVRQAPLHGVRSEALQLNGLPVLHDVNPVRFERMVSNLLENAARYGGGATIVKCHHVGNVLQLSVEDDGPGVPVDERRSVFGRFNRGTSVASPEHPKGTGLGLSLVEEYVRLESGKVWIEDGRNGGARFVIEIPGRN